ncbi:MAG: FAD-binding protein, partial [Dehalococcoidia bacterium]
MTAKIGLITPEIIEELVNIVGNKYVITDGLDIQGYARDEAPFEKVRYPRIVVKPGDVVTVAGILKLANNYRLPVVPRGAGTGLSGGAASLSGDIVISTERLNKILEIDENNFTAVVESGVTLSKLREEVENIGLYYPLYPGESSATLGGNVSTNAGGMNAVKYGVTRHHVLGIEAVLPNGSTIICGGKFVKSSSGYDLTQLITGSEGTLAVITKIVLRLSTKPARRDLLYAPFNDLQAAINAVPDILKLPKTPIGLEFIEKDIIKLVEKYTGKEMPYHDYAAFIMLIMEGNSEDEIMEYFGQVENICKQHGAADVLIPNSERAKRQLLESREKFYTVIQKCAPFELIDIVVPRSEIARFVSEIKMISASTGIPVIAYGHAGDGNVHLHPVCMNISTIFWQDKLPQMLVKIYQAGINCGGAVSGEHGIGLAKKSYLAMQLSPEHLNLLKGIKKVFDPNNILNPGKIF